MAGQGDKHSLRGQGLCYLLTPLHSAHAAPVQIVLPTNIEELLRASQPVHVKVKQGESAALILVDNGEGRACDPADISQPPGKPSGKGGFAHAKPAAVCDHSAGGERPGKTRTQGLCLRFIVGEIVHSSLQSIALFPMLPQFERSVKRNLQRLHTFFLVVYCLILGICQKAEDVWNTMYGGQGI